MLVKERMYTFNEYSMVAEHRDVGHGVMSINCNFIDIYGDKGIRGN